MITIGSNSWVTVIEADAYLSDRVDTTEWFALPDTNIVAGTPVPGTPCKEGYLIMAYRWLRSRPGLVLPSSSTDSALLEAQILSANWVLNWMDDVERRDALRATGVTAFDFSKWKESLSSDPPLPSFILGLLNGYCNENTLVDLVPRV